MDKICTNSFRILLLSFLYLLKSTSYASSLTLEAGALWQNRNDVRIPGKTGTLVSFDEYDPGPFLHYRVEGHHQFSETHGIRFIYAPLKLSVTGVEGNDIYYNNNGFSGNSPVEINYEFNSYRLGYTYLAWQNTQSYFKIGLTGKIRQASITFTQGSQSSRYDNVGFVPLFYYALRMNLFESLYFYSDADFAYASQGRAFDFSFKLRKEINEDSILGVGGRFLEGGADNEKVLTFSFISYAVLDYQYRF